MSIIPIERPLVSVLISNYNYACYLSEAIDSVLNQTYSPVEIIVVDDASTDESLNLIKEKYELNPNLKVIAKEKNQGQLSAINDAFLNSSGDIIFFLDSDDFYYSQYLEIAVNIYINKPECGFLSCAMGIFKHIENVYQPPSQEQITKLSDYVRDYGYSVVLTLEEQWYVGSPSSGNSIRREYLSSILPCDYLSEYRIWADNCIVYGASIIGARKFFVGLPLVAYRMHGKNDSLTASFLKDRFKLYQNQIALTRLFTVLCSKMNYTQSFISRNAPYEFKTIEYPTWELFFIYLKIIMRSPLSIPYAPPGLLQNKFHGFGMMLKHMLTQNTWWHKITEFIS
jgi:glycosyltransferase involved in cell wall biosynthesis